MNIKECVFYYFFFFQAEDGIRDYKVTGVQTCALPISLHGVPAPELGRDRLLEHALVELRIVERHRERPQIVRRRLRRERARDTGIEAAAQVAADRYIGAHPQLHARA